MALSRKKVEFLLSVLLVFFFAWILWQARNWPAQSKLFPWSLGIAALGLGLIQVLAAWRAVVREGRGGVEKSLPADANDRVAVGDASVPRTDPAHWRLVTICGWVLGFFLGIWLFGFKLGALCLTFVFLKVTAREGWAISAAIAAGSYLFFWLVFDVALRVPLGSGWLLEYYRDWMMQP